MSKDGQSRGSKNFAAVMFQKEADPSQQMFDSSCNSRYIEDVSISNNDSYNDMSSQLSDSCTSNMGHSINPQESNTASDQRRSSIFMSPVGIGAMLDVDFDDEEDVEEDDNSNIIPAPSTAGALPSGGGNGSPNHRPMVGGFAAAAYEAARADHYKKQQNKKVGVPAATKGQQQPAPPSSIPF